MASYTETWPTISSTLSTGQDLVWTERSGNSEVIGTADVGNVFTIVDSGTRSVATATGAPLASVDMAVEAVIPRLRVNYGDVEVIARTNATDLKGYAWRIGTRGTDGALFHELTKKDAAGVETNLTTETTYSASLPDTIRVEVEGTTVRCYIDGALIHTVVDDGTVGGAAITAGNLFSLSAFRSNIGANRYADIGQVTAADLAAAAPPGEAAGSGTWTFIGSGSGQAPVLPVKSGSGVGAWSFTGAGSGTAPVVGVKSASGAGAWSFTGSGAGATSRRASGSGSWAFTGSGVGDDLADTLTARFDSLTLPTGWSEYDPAGHGSVVLDGSHARLLHGSAARESFSGTGAGATNLDASIGLEHALDGGDFDIAFRVDGTDAGDHGDVLRHSLNLLIVGASTADVVRFSLFQNGTDEERLALFFYKRVGGTGTNVIGSTTFNRHFGGAPNWYRVKHTAATGLYRIETSGDGVTWVSNYNYATAAASPAIETTAAFTPAKIVLGLHNSNGGTDLPAVRVARVVNMLTHGSDDVREDVPTRFATLVSTLDGTAGTWPADWTAAGSGGVFSETFTGTALRLQAATATEDPNLSESAAAVRYTGPAVQDWRLYIQATNPQPDTDFYFTPGMLADPVGTSDLTGTGANDMYVRGGGYGLEVQSGPIRRLIRVDDDSDRTTNPVAPFPTGLDETPYHHLDYLPTQPTFGTGTHHFLFERVGGRYRVKEWTGLRGDEPVGWNLFDGDEYVNTMPMRPWLSYSYNNNGGSSRVDVQLVELYELTATPPPTTASGSGSFTWTGGGLGKAARGGAGGGAYAYAGSGVGFTPAVGVKSASGFGAWTYVGAGVGSTVRSAVGAGAFALAGSGVGSATGQSDYRDTVIVAVLAVQNRRTVGLAARTRTAYLEEQP